MNEHEKQFFEVEAAKGEHHRQVWESIILPIFTEKEAELFEVFKDTGTSDSDALITIKLQLNALNVIKEHFESKINSGAMARKTLDEESKDDN